MKKETSIYPWRHTEKAVEDAQRLQKEEPTPLSSEEREHVLAWEYNLAESLDKVHKLPVVAPRFYVDYFLTPEGRADYKSVTGRDLAATTREDIVEELWNERVALRTDVDTAKRLADRSQKFFQANLKKQLLAHITEDGMLDITACTDVVLHTKTRCGIMLNPETIQQKIDGLYVMHERVRGELKTLSVDHTAETMAKADILRLYQKRINELVARLQQEIGDTIHEGKTITNEETAIIERRPYSDARRSRALGRYDKFVFGASREYDDVGDHKVLTQKLLLLADEIEELTIKSNLQRDAILRSRGIDPAKLGKKDISYEEAQAVANDVLDAYSLKSSDDPGQYRADRIGFAADGKWQAVPVEKGMGVANKQHVVKIPRLPMTAESLVTVLIGHEIEGHVLQHHNKEQCPLQLIARVGGDRSELYAEMGAMYNQDAIAQEIFGVRALPGSQYVRAMAVRCDGGDYLQCVAAYYTSGMRLIKEQHAQGLLSDEAFKNEIEKKLTLAIDRTLRLFRGDDTLFGGVPTKSKDLVYLEQLHVMQELAAVGMDKYAFIAGVTAENARILKKWGLLDEAAIMPPRYEALKVWDRIKDRYALDAAQGTTA